MQTPGGGGADPWEEGVQTPGRGRVRPLGGGGSDPWSPPSGPVESPRGPLQAGCGPQETKYPFGCAKPSPEGVLWPPGPARVGLSSADQLGNIEQI